MASMLTLVGWNFGEDPTEHVFWIRGYWAELEPFTHGFYANDTHPDASAAMVNANFRENYDRL